MYTNTNLNRLGFGMLTRWNSYVLIAFVEWRQITQSLSGQILFGIGGKRSIRVCLNQGMANYVNTVYFIHQGKYLNPSRTEFVYANGNT